MSRRATKADGRNAASALELALRAARSGLTTCVIQLLPGREPYGELVVPGELLTKLNVFPAFHDDKTNGERAAGTANSLELARLALACGRYDLVILDEVPSALSAGDVSEDEIRGLAGAGAETRLIAIGMHAGNSLTAAFGSP